MPKLLVRARVKVLDFERDEEREVDQTDRVLTLIEAGKFELLDAPAKSKAKRAAKKADAESGG